ncbi:MAG: polysaccharide export protein [Bradyrhizobiaceae bacterium]|nr:MAG: polysaccharide export protein [Bradyrhizobiaceae bacterium]
MRAFRLPLIAALFLALAVSGCMHTPVLPTGTVAGGGDLDMLAYNIKPNLAGPVPYTFSTSDGPYRLDAGDKLRIVVFGQEGLTNTYAVDAGGAITMPLIGAVRARGLTPPEVAAVITAKLKKGYLREPYVAVEVETYRPFFILGEVTAPGQYPFVPNMTVESAIAIAGGFTPRAFRTNVTITRTDASGASRVAAPMGTLLRPGDTIQVSERWF